MKYRCPKCNKMITRSELPSVYACHDCRLVFDINRPRLPCSKGHECSVHQLLETADSLFGVINAALRYGEMPTGCRAEANRAVDCARGILARFHEMEKP